MGCIPKIIAVDPGLSGAVVLYCPETHELFLYRDFKKVIDIVDAIHHLCSQYKLTRGIIELVGSRPGQGIVSTSHFMIAYGCAMGALGVETLDEKVSKQIFNVHPVRWQNWVRRELSLFDDTRLLCDRFMYKPDYKGFDSRVYAVNCFPEYIQKFERQKDHNTADAVLLAVYCYWFGRELMLKNYLAAMWAFRNGHRDTAPILEDCPCMEAAGLDKFPLVETQPYQL